MGPRLFLVWTEGRSEGGSGIRGMKNLRGGFASAPARLFSRGIGRMEKQLVLGRIIWSEYSGIKVYSIKRMIVEDMQG